MWTTWTVVALAMAAAVGGCGGGDGSAAATTTSTTTTSTSVGTPASSCPGQFQIPLALVVDDHCLDTYLISAAEQQSLDLTGDASTQATALCREISVSGFTEATALAFLAWDEGSRPIPSPDRPGFVALAIGIYCPEYFDMLRSLNDSGAGG